MTRRYPRAKWPLPAVVNPTGSRCITIPVPDDDTHVACFLGALANLASAAQWSDDPNHTAREVALVWRDIIDDLEWGCDVQTQLRMDTDCGTIQYSYDNGITWHDLTNIAACVNAGIQDAIDDGTIATPSQQPAGGTIPALECHTYKITLRGNERWHSPVPVTAGYSVTVSASEGAWSDNNTLLANWFCPPGTTYGLGQCGSAVAALPGDPLQSANHMRLIGYCNGVYMDMHDTSYTVPNGTPLSDFYLMANDGSLSDNNGEIRLTVAICNYSEWCYTFNFRTANGDWIATKDSNNEGGANWVNGEGWQSVWNAGRHTQHINLKRDFDDSYLTRIEAEYDLIIDSATLKYHAVSISLNTVQTYGAAIPAVNGNNLYDHAFSPQIGADQIVFEMRQYADSTDWSYLRSVTLHGTGVNPFGTSNCT